MSARIIIIGAAAAVAAAVAAVVARRESDASSDTSYGLSQRRAAALAAVAEVVPSQYPQAAFRTMAPTFDPANLPVPGYTPCAELPRFVGSRLSPPINTRGGLESIRDIGRANNVWREAGGDARPSPGDFYVLVDDHDTPTHVGVIIDASDDAEWQTADAGQRNGAASSTAYVTREYDADAVTLAGRHLAGWYDIDGGISV